MTSTRTTHLTLSLAFLLIAAVVAGCSNGSSPSGATAPAGQATLAQTTDECLALIAELREKTDDRSQFLSNPRGRGQGGADKDLAGLLGKLDGAAKKLQQGKTGDAIAKLMDYKAKVESLIAEGKIVEAFGQSLLSDPAGVDVQDVLDCINGS